jgi:hypothetical protein
MNRRQGRTVVVVGGVAAVLFLLLLLLVRVSHFPTGLHMLPVQGMRGAIHATTGKNLPETMEAAQGLVNDTRDMWAFVRFHTDKAGIAYVLQTFRDSGAKEEILNERQWRDWSGFQYPERWQKELGVRVYALNSIHSAIAISRSPVPASPQPGTGYTVLIDQERGDVYVLGMQV